jgi:hypothetical protein
MYRRLKECIMLAKIVGISSCPFLAVIAPALADEQVPFRGKFAGRTLSAVPTDDPAVLLVTSGGGGEATHLGRYTFVSPHYANLVTGEAVGIQYFTAANGDVLIAEFSGQFLPIEGGLLAATLEASVTGGTGQFEGATGSYTFDIVFNSATFRSVAMIDGTVSTPDE